ncbi:MAG: hypothetical protein K6G52_08455 [Treponemataceae bacterium]|nr:hypothetical protein [Treponemataceae bacterium]
MIVENGTGLADANSYVSVEFADDYFSARGVSEWDDLETEVKEQLLIKATDFVDNIYEWYGKKEFEQQALRFPRVDICDYEGAKITGIPTCLKQAVCDASLISKNGELFETAEQNGDVTSETITTLSFQYSKQGSRSTTSTTLYDALNTKLRGLFKDKSKSRILSGKVERV